MSDIREAVVSLSDDGMSPPTPKPDLGDELAPPQCALDPVSDGMVGPGGCPECIDDGMSSDEDADSTDGMKGPGGCPECIDDGMSPPQ